MCPPCNPEGTKNQTRCQQDTGHCSCKDGWYGHLCLYGKLKKKHFIMSVLIFHKMNCIIQKSWVQLHPLHPHKHHPWLLTSMNTIWAFKEKQTNIWTDRQIMLTCSTMSELLLFTSLSFQFFLVVTKIIETGGNDLRLGPKLVRNPQFLPYCFETLSFLPNHEVVLNDI